jgi:predicted nucleic acid-binding protein
MGILLDSSVVIGAQRAKQTPAALIETIVAGIGNHELSLSSIGYTELVHGHYRSKTDLQRQASRNFLDALILRLPVHPYTVQTAELVGRLDAERAEAGLTIPLIDLMIGATALSLNFSILTVNLRHFRMIPNLTVIPFV